MNKIQAFYGFKKIPFPKVADLSNIFESKDHTEGYARISYAIENGEICLISGETGVGTSTTIRKYIYDANSTTHRIIYIQAAKYTLFDFYEYLAEELHVASDGCHKTRIIRGIKHSISQNKGKGIKTVLVIDDIDLMPSEILNELKVLYDYGIDDSEAITIVMVSSSGFRNLLRSERHRVLRDNIIVNYDYHGFDLKETKAYIEKHLTDSKVEPLENKHYAMIYEYTEGKAKKINKLMNNLLLIGMIQEKTKFTVEDLQHAEKEMGL